MRALALAFVLIGLTGCSTFHREWKEAAKIPPSAASIAGRWDGTWLSDKNGHHGRLRCVLTEIEPRKYHAHFHATFWKIFRAAYEVELLTTDSPTNGVVNFSGANDLGWLFGGLYSYEGSASPANFFSTYKAKVDHGTFQMTRPGNP